MLDRTFAAGPEPAELMLPAPVDRNRAALGFPPDSAWSRPENRYLYPHARPRQPDAGPAGRPHPPPRPAGRALIGDQLRMPVAWCQLGSCIARYTHPGALGERDIRARAIAAGWRFDALGRLACPGCQQHDSSFQATAPVVLWRPAADPDDTAPAWPGPGFAGDAGRPCLDPAERLGEPLGSPAGPARTGPDAGEDTVPDRPLRLAFPAEPPAGLIRRLRPGAAGRHHRTF